MTTEQLNKLTAIRPALLDIDTASKTSYNDVLTVLGQGNIAVIAGKLDLTPNKCIWAIVNALETVASNNSDTDIADLSL